MEVLREAFETLVGLVVERRYGADADGFRWGIVRKEFYDLLRQYHDFDHIETSPTRRSVIRKIEDAGLLPNLYAYAYQEVNDQLRDDTLPRV